MAQRIAHWAFVAVFAAIAAWLIGYSIYGFNDERVNAAEQLDYYLSAGGFALAGLVMAVLGKRGQPLAVTFLSVTIGILALRFGLPLSFVEESTFYWIALAISAGVAIYSVLLFVRASPEALALSLAAAYAGFLAWVGVFMVMLGYQLISAGGSPYYVLAGLMLLAVALFVMRRNIWAPRLHAVLMALTVVWSVVEAGLDFFPLLARMAAFIVVGLWFALPSSRQLFYSARGEMGARRDFRWAEAASGLGALVMLVALLPLSPVQEGSKFDVAKGEPTTDWRNYGNSTQGTRFAQLDQITPQNVKGMRRVWAYRTKVPYDNKNTPLMVDGLVYTCTGYNTLIALNADTGQEAWRTITRDVAPENDPAFRNQSTYARTCRGLGYYEVGKGGSALPEPVAAPTPAPPVRGARVAPAPAPAVPADCPTRIITNTTNARLIAVDAKTGAKCQSFGTNGEVNLRAGMGPTANQYFVTSAPLVAKDIVVVGGWVTDSQQLGMPSGVLRAYSAKTGAFVWAWDMGRPDFHGTPDEGGEFTRGTPNVWSHTSYDPELNLIYAPTGNSSPDYFAGELRTKEANEHSSSVVAIDAATGAERWTYQTVHSDVWDYDVPSQPVLVDVRRDGAVVPAVAVPTKRAEIFLLDRRDGKPVYPIEEKPVPQNPEPGEKVPATQPMSPLPNFREDRNEDDMWGLTPLDQLYCRIEFKKMRYEGHFTPIMKGVTPSGTRREATYAEKKFVGGHTSGGTFQYPGNAGGFNWGSVSVDADNGLLIAAPMQMGNRITLSTAEETRAQTAETRKRQEIWDKAHPRPKATPATATQPLAPAAAPQRAPAVQPRGDRAGPGGPGGAGGGAQRDTRFDASKVTYRGATSPFMSAFFVPFLGETQMPCFEPPFGIIAAIDLNTNKLMWKHAFGSMRESGPFGWKAGLDIDVGTPTQGSSITTRGGLIFHAGSMDASIRAFDTRSGAELWQAPLPGSAHATPITFMAPSGRQMVVVTVPDPSWEYPRPTLATLEQPRDDLGGWVIAFALEGR